MYVSACHVRIASFGGVYILAMGWARIRRLEVLDVSDGGGREEGEVRSAEVEGAREGEKREEREGGETRRVRPNRWEFLDQDVLSGRPSEEGGERVSGW
ncbi:hypothetical protein BELL_0723g00060 [Botrytis elliptica]|uniref:Uncharacterized protein n=1 Tax=Botrytis elliptica TaxID=278938 RepID=A0A4Z1JMB7_9HELO|nr:hypothetical protein BELL_0723g00060 [Botrytis elliptica]